MPATAPLVQIEVWSKPRCAAGASRITTLRDYWEPETIESIDREESGSFTIGLDNQDIAELVEGRALVFQYAPATVGATAGYDEYLLLDIAKAHAVQGNSVRVVGRGLAFPFTMSGSVPLWTAGVPAYRFTASYTISQWLSLLILPQMAARGFSWYAAGTIDPSQTLTLSVADHTATELLNMLATAAECEWRVRRNGTTDYRVDFLTSIGSGLATVALRPGRHLLGTRVESSLLPTATRLLPLGTQYIGDEVARTIALCRWKVTAVDGTNKDLTVAPIDGSSVEKCIKFDGQFSTVGGQPANAYVLVLKSGEALEITNSYVATQKLRVAAVGQVVANDFIELRATKGTVAAASLPWLSNSSALGTLMLDKRPGRVSNVSGTDLTLTNAFTSDPVPFNSTFLYARVRASLPSATVSITANATDQGNRIGRVTVSSTATLAVGDWGWFTSGSEPWSPVGSAFEIVAIVSGTQFDYGFHYPADAIQVGGTAPPQLPNTTFVVRVARPRVQTDPIVTAANAGTNVVTVSAIASIALNDWLEFYWDGRDDALLATLTAPERATYGDIERKYTRDDLNGLVNIGHDANPYFDTWTGGNGTAPDGYTSGSFGTKLSTGLIGPGAVYNGVTPNALLTPVLYANFGRLSGGLGWLFVRVRIKTPASATWANQNFDLQLRDRNTASGGSTKFASQIWSQLAGATNIVIPDGDTIYDLDWLVQLDACGYNSAAAGFQLRLHSGVAVQVGGWAIYQVALGPTESLFVRYADAHKLWHAGNEKLDEVRLPDRTFEIDALDLARLDPAANGDEALEVGTPVRLENPTLFGASPPSQRIVRIERQHAEPARSVVTVEKLPRTLTTLLASQLA